MTNLPQRRPCAGKSGDERRTSSFRLQDAVSFVLELGPCGVRSVLDYMFLMVCSRCGVELWRDFEKVHSHSTVQKTVQLGGRLNTFEAARSALAAFD